MVTRWSQPVCFSWVQLSCPGLFCRERERVQELQAYNSQISVPLNNWCGSLGVFLLSATELSLGFSAERERVQELQAYNSQISIPLNNWCGSLAWMTRTSTILLSALELSWTCLQNKKSGITSQILWSWTFLVIITTKSFCIFIPDYKLIEMHQVFAGVFLWGGLTENNQAYWGPWAYLS